ncbi:hypothetical protein ACU8KH_03439 [Lachancea thermotolerans]
MIEVETISLLFLGAFCKNSSSGQWVLSLHYLGSSDLLYRVGGNWEKRTETKQSKSTTWAQIRKSLRCQASLCQLVKPPSFCFNNNAEPKRAKILIVYH